MVDSKRARSWKRRTLPRIDLTNAEPVLYSTRFPSRSFQNSEKVRAPAVYGDQPSKTASAGVPTP